MGKHSEALAFTIGKAKYYIGSKMFPVSQKSKVKLFDFASTELIEDESLYDLVDSLGGFEAGMCYSSAELTMKALRMHGYEDVEYYSGWLFVHPSAPPIHHAWVMLNGKHLIDTSINIYHLKCIAEFTEKFGRYEGFRKDLAREMAKYSGYPKSKTSVMGESPFMYVGSPDTPDNAKATFRKLIKDYPHHPSYAHRDGMNPEGRSKLQEEMLQAEWSNR